jgi:hypothetical protein
LLRSAIEPDPSYAVRPDAVTVNSSPWAVQVYERLGFSATKRI